VSRIKFAQGDGIVTLHASGTSWTKPTALTDGGQLGQRIASFSPPDVLIHIKGASDWVMDKMTGVFGMLEDGTWDRIEGPLGSGALLSGLAGTGQSYLIAAGGYKRLAISAFDGTTLTSSSAVIVTAIPVFSREGI
jgi:hypothetical protein